MDRVSNLCCPGVRNVIPSFPSPGNLNHISHKLVVHVHTCHLLQINAPKCHYLVNNSPFTFQREAPTVVHDDPNITAVLAATRHTVIILAWGEHRKVRFLMFPVSFLHHLVPCRLEFSFFPLLEITHIWASDIFYGEV